MRMIVTDPKPLSCDLPMVLSPDGNDFNADFSIIPLPERKMRMIVTDPKPLSCDYDPHTQPKSYEDNYFADLFEFARKAIDGYNATHTNDYFELVDPLYLREFRTNNWRDGDLYHVSFIARSQKYSYFKLFFAEFAYSRQLHICTPVDPGNPFVSTRCGACHPDGIIYHPVYTSASQSSAGGGSRRLSSAHAHAKKFLRDVYTITSDVEELVFDNAYELQKNYQGHAFEALKKFNSENDATYELVELVACNRFVCKDVSEMAPYWAHLTFTANVKDGDGIQSPSVPFFAEVGFATNYVYVTTCVILPTIDDSAIPLSGNGMSCAVCPDNCPMFHPEGEYVAGYEGGDFADSMFKGRFRAVKSKLQMKDDDASLAAREEYYTYVWSGGRKSATSSQRHTH